MTNQETMSLLFTDIEGSTEELERIGEARWLALRDQHDKHVRRCVDTERGRVVKAMGDGYLLAFSSTRGALRCALAIVHGQGDVRVRAGLHVGEVTVDQDDVHGRAVVKAARVSALANGGEVLVSATVRDLVDDDAFLFGAAREVELRGLQGSHVIYDVTGALNSEADSLRVALADDSAIIRDGLAAVLRASGLEVIGVASDATELLALVSTGRPDVVLVDIRMPPTFTDEGLVAAERISRTSPGVGLLVLSQQAEPALAMRLLDAFPSGGVGYLLKDRVSDIEMLISAIERIHSGGTVIDPQLSQRIVKRGARVGSMSDLTPRELEVLSLIAEGRSNRAIADELFVTPKTLEGHISQIFMKLGLREAGEEHRRVSAVLAYLSEAGDRRGDATSGA